MPSDIILPYKFKPRDYQKPLFDAMFKENKKRFNTVWPRRSGKDKTYINLCVAASQRRVGTYIYLFPKLNQGRRVIWNGMDRDGMKFLDHFPKELIKRTNGTDMLIEMKNGSIFQLGGSDRYDNLMGTNPIGIVLSEYSLQNPMAWHHLRPILVENGGWAAFNYTPRGQNHGYELYENSKNNPSWFTELLTIESIKDGDGNRIITDEMVQEEIDAGMPEEMVQQEFYCSFSAAIPGAYYAKYLERIEADGRICDFPIDNKLAVHTFWDIGVRDPTGIWFAQLDGKEIKLIDYYQHNGEGIQHYINYLHDFRNKHQIVYGDHFAPHDISVREWGSGNTRWETARDLGVNFKIAPKLPVQDGIYAVRNIFNRVVIHKTNCAFGVKAIRNYSHEWNPIKRVFADTPNHDWSSHCADALRYLAVSISKVNDYNNMPEVSSIPMNNWSVY